MAVPQGRVLVVDEDPLWRLAVDRQLEMLGWDVLTLNAGEEAIRVVERGFIVEVLLADLRLPDIDGRQVAWALCRLLPHVRIAFMASQQPNTPLEPANAPLLIKPFSTTALANALAGAVAWQAPPLW